MQKSVCKKCRKYARMAVWLWPARGLPSGSSCCHLQEGWGQRQEWGVLPGPSQWWLDSVSELQVSGTPLPATRLGPVLRDTRDLTPPTPRPWLLSCPLHRREPLRRLTRFCSWAITLDHGTVCQAAIHQASVSPSVKWAMLSTHGAAGNPHQPLHVKTLCALRRDMHAAY